MIEIDEKSLRQALGEFVLSTYSAQLTGQTDVEIHDSFTELELFDSLTLLSYIEFLESEFDIVIPSEDVTPNNFDSIALTVAYLRAKGAVG